mmetsp:Transcript_53100/g.172638  ORF Transcript_53100/g.172638 Transcript_53100/m.172638 type:complete len:238 (+) Transcript_53100:409-1122(+)
MGEEVLPQPHDVEAHGQRPRLELGQALAEECLQLCRLRRFQVAFILNLLAALLECSGPDIQRRAQHFLGRTLAFAAVSLGHGFARLTLFRLDLFLQLVHFLRCRRMKLGGLIQRSPKSRRRHDLEVRSSGRCSVCQRALRHKAPDQREAERILDARSITCRGWIVALSPVHRCANVCQGAHEDAAAIKGRQGLHRRQHRLLQLLHGWILRPVWSWQLLVELRGKRRDSLCCVHLFGS